MSQKGDQDRAFVARLMVFQESLAGSIDLFDLEDRQGLSDFTAVTADDSEDLSGVGRLGHVLLRLVSELLVEEPLVDLDPVEAGDLDGLPALPAVQFAARSSVEMVQVVNLVAIFTCAVGLQGVVTTLFAEALARDEGRLSVAYGEFGRGQLRREVVVDVRVRLPRVEEGLRNVVLFFRDGLTGQREVLGGFEIWRTL